MEIDGERSQLGVRKALCFGVFEIAITEREIERVREKGGLILIMYSETPVSIVCCKIQVTCMSHPYLLRSAFSLLGPRGETPMQRIPLALPLALARDSYLLRRLKTIDIEY